MTSWNEADHPRDEDGKFTYKNGGASNTSSNTTLYGGIEYNNIVQGQENISYKDTSLKGNLANYKNKLIYFLGNNLDRAEILYSTAAELENKILDNTISTINVSREKIFNSINNLSKNELKSNPNFKNIIKKAKNTYNALNDFEVKANNMFKINTQKGQNGFGEEAISSVLRFQKSLEKDCNEIVMTAKNIENRKTKIEDNKISSMPINRVEIPIDQAIKYKRAVEAVIPPIQEKSKISDKYKIKTPQSENIADWIMPCEGRISSPYGWRIHPIKKERIFHNGIDIAVSIGTPIQAIADGKVVKSGVAKGYGYSVVLEHNLNGEIYTSEYGHILNPKIVKDTIVKQGDIIAYSGNEGASKGPHLHLTIRKGKYIGEAKDPKKFLIDLRN